MRGVRRRIKVKGQEKSLEQRACGLFDCVKVVSHEVLIGNVAKSFSTKPLTF